MRRVRNGRRTVPAWTRNVHTVERLGVTIDEFPEAMQDVIACNRMLRREFWNERIGPFAEGVAYEDHVPMVAAFVRARAFDVLSAFTYNWRIRENATSIGQQKHRASESARPSRPPSVRRCGSSRPRRRSRSGRPGSDGWSTPTCRSSCRRHWWPTTTTAALQEAAAEFLALSGPDVLQHARADRKLMTALMAAGEWDEVDRLAEHVRLHGILPETQVRDGRVMAELPFGRRPATCRPASTSWACTRRAWSPSVSGVRWSADRTLHLEGWAYIRGIDLTETVPQIEAWLQQLDKDRVLPLAVEHTVRSDATLAANDPNQRYDRAGFPSTVPARRSCPHRPLAAPPPGPGRRRRAEGAVHALTRFGTWDRMPSSPSVDAEDPSRIVPVLDEADGFVLEIRTDRFRAVQLETAARRDAGRRGRGPGPAAQPTDRGGAGRPAGRPGAAPLTVDAAGHFAFALPAARRRSAPSACSSSPRTVSGTAWPGRRVDADTAATLRRRRTRPAPGGAGTPRGLVQVVTGRAAVPGRPGLSVDADQLRLDVAVERISADELTRCRLSATAVSVPPTSVEPVAPGTVAADLPADRRGLAGGPGPPAADRHLPPARFPAAPEEIAVVAGCGAAGAAAVDAT